jgi:hypothetical protein
MIDARRIKWIVAGVLAVLVGVVVWLFVRAAGDEATGERWDRLTALRYGYEPNEDPFQADPSGLVRKQRERFVQQLEDFLEKEAKGSGDALEPHVRFLIAKASRDTLLSMGDVTDFAQRKPFHDKAIEQLTILRDRFPDFPANWSTLAPPGKGKASTIRMLLEETEQARAHEEASLPRERMPKDDVVVLVRTDRGDMRFGVYAEDAPETVAAFLRKAREGRFDGTAFYEKEDTGGDESAGRRTVRGGDPKTRGAKPYDKAQPKEFGKLPPEEQLLPGDSRNRIPHRRGILSAWHGTASEYDETGEFLLVARTSPDMDYHFTPIARALDGASLATIDRIWASPAWRDDRTAAPDETGAIQDFLQVPVRIVKVLVYEKGALSTGDVTPVPERAEVEEAERSLSTVESDRYRVEAPPRPAAPKPPADAPKDPETPKDADAPKDEKPADEKPGDAKPDGETPSDGR